MRARLRESYRLFSTTIAEFVEDDCMSMAAALAFYTLFSLPPLLLISVTLVSTLFPFTRQQVSEEVQYQINALIGQQAGEQAVAMLETAGQTGPSTAATIFGIGVLLFAATSVLAQLQYSLNVAWEVEPDPAQGGLKNFLVKRVFSLAMLLAIAFLLLVSLLVTAALEAFDKRIQEWFISTAATTIIKAVNFVLSLVVVTFLFGATYRVLPDARITWRDVSVGAAVSAVLFAIGKHLIGIYLGNSQIGSAYGAASTLAIILIWVYYASLIMLLGAEFTQVWARRYGTGLRPIRGAVRAVRTKEHVRPGEMLPAESKERREGKIREEG